MRIAVSGATGYVARLVVAELAEHHDLVLFTRRPIESESEVVVGDLLDPRGCREAVDGADVVVHLAVEQTDEDRMFLVNVEGTYQLARAAADAGVRRFVMASSSCVYGHCFADNPFGFTPNTLPIDEEQPCDPHRTYGYSKLASELALRYVARRKGMEAAALRLNWVWGEQEVTWWVDEQKMDLNRMAHNFWAYADARDVSTAFRLATEVNDMSVFDTYNVCAADTVADAFSSELITRFHPELALLAEDLNGNDSMFSWQKANNAFGYRPAHSWREYL